MSETLIIVPTYNERDNAEPLMEAVFRVCPDVDLLFVDDNSPDGTGALLDELAGRDPRVNVIHRKDKQGLGRAYIAGFQWALGRAYEFVMEMDADFSHEPTAIPAFREAAQTADLVLGSRYIGGIRVLNWPLNRLVLSQSAGLYVRAITGMPFSDPTGGFKCFRRRVLENIHLDEVTSNGYSFQIEMTHYAWMNGFKIVDIPITFIERQAGTSKMHPGIVREALWMVWRLWFRYGLRRRPKATEDGI